MGKIVIPPLVKLVVGLLSNNRELISQTKQRLTNQYGPLERESALFPFDCTRYYQREIGPDLRRQYVSFERLVPREQLPRIKRSSN
ncbi:MAG: DUF4416 family protein, partial [Candidatus Binatia bacterium]